MGALAEPWRGTFPATSTCKKNLNTPDNYLLGIFFTTHFLRVLTQRLVLLIYFSFLKFSLFLIVPTVVVVDSSKLGSFSVTTIDFSFFSDFPRKRPPPQVFEK